MTNTPNWGNVNEALGASFGVITRASSRRIMQLGLKRSGGTRAEWGGRPQLSISKLLPISIAG